MSRWNTTFSSEVGEMGVGKMGVGEQGISQPEWRMLFCLGNVTNLLPLATQSHIHYDLHQFYFKFKDLVAKQLHMLVSVPN